MRRLALRGFYAILDLPGENAPSDEETAGRAARLLAARPCCLQLRGKRLPDWAVAGSNYAAWLVLSAAVAFFLLRD